MPYVLKKNRKAIEEKIISLSRYLNLKDETFDGFMNWILDLRKKLLIPHTLKELIDDDTKFSCERIINRNFLDKRLSIGPVFKKFNFPLLSL